MYGAYDVNVAKPGDTVHIPLSEREALAGLMAVKPTQEMPRPGTNPGKKKPKKQRSAGHRLEPSRSLELQRRSGTAEVRIRHLRMLVFIGQRIAEDRIASVHIQPPSFTCARTMSVTSV